MFRNWLRDHDDDRDRYAAVKRGLAELYDDVRDYADAKNAIIDDIYARAFAAGSVVDAGGRPAHRESVQQQTGRKTCTGALTGADPQVEQRLEPRSASTRW